MNNCNWFSFPIEICIQEQARKDNNHLFWKSICPETLWNFCYSLFYLCFYCELCTLSITSPSYQSHFIFCAVQSNATDNFKSTLDAKTISWSGKNDHDYKNLSLFVGLRHINTDRNNENDYCFSAKGKKTSNENVIVEI